MEINPIGLKLRRGNGLFTIALGRMPGLRRVRDAPLARQMAEESVDQTGPLAYLLIMPLLPIITLPDPLLRQKSAPIETVSDEVRALANAMLETMYTAPGIGLAAVQVGVLRRLLVLDTAKGEDVPKDPHVLINPEILSFGDTPRLHEEGCLSIPRMYAEVERPALVRVRYVDLDGKEQERDFADLQATVVQHEIDHLEGVLFIDHLSRLRRNLLIRKYHKSQREKAAAEQL